MSAGPNRGTEEGAGRRPPHAPPRCRYKAGWENMWMAMWAQRQLYHHVIPANGGSKVTKAIAISVADISVHSQTERNPEGGGVS